MNGPRRGLIFVQAIRSAVVDAEERFAGVVALFDIRLSIV